MSQARYLSEIDGLRAVAVTLVLLFHAGALSMGWSGVWLFYVISGFVITLSLDGREPEAGGLKESLLDFYKRRALRILPLYFLIVAIGAVVNGVTGALGNQFWPQLLSLLTFTFNFARMDGGFEHSMMSGHLWSLSVEEHFYLLFPLLYFMLPRRWLGPALCGVIVAAVGIRWGVSALYAANQPVGAGVEWSELRASGVYRFSPAHFDAFAMGALMALMRDELKRLRWLLPVLLAVTAAGWVLLFVSVQVDPAAGADVSRLALFASGDVLDVTRYCLLNLSACCLVLAVLQGRQVLTALLSARPLVHVGRVSFGVYVYHFPLQLLFMTFLPGNVAPLLMFAVCMTASVIVATLSFHFFERPIQQWGRGRHGSLGTGKLRPGRA